LWTSDSLHWGQPYDGTKNGEQTTGVNSQGRTLAKARRNLKEALRVVPRANHELTSQALQRECGARVLREPVTV